MKATELRQSILKAAVQGKLVPQNIHDEPALKLLEYIRQEKNQLIKEGKYTKEKPLLPITEDEVLYDLPDGWVWCKLDTIALSISTGPFGSMLHKTDYVHNGIPLVNPANIVNEAIVPSSRMMISEDTKQRLLRYVLSAGDIIVARRGKLGRCAIVTENEEGWICGTGSFFLRISKYVFPRYFTLFFRSIVSVQQLIGNSVGSTMNNLNHFILRNLMVPLPPLAEQQRIVSKVDELLALCDELEAAEKELDKLEADFAEYLPKSILQAAVQGKLVPQSIHDEPATELLKHIQQEKSKLIKEGKLKKEKPLPPISEYEMPYDLPEGWVWCRLGEIAFNHDSKRKPVSVEFRRNVEKKYDYYGATGAIDKVEDYLFDGLFLLIGEDGGNFFVNRDVAFIVKGKFWANNHVHVLSFSFDILTEYIKIQLNALDLPGLGLINGIAVPKLNQQNLNSIIVALPPLAEQQHIIAKVNELMALCDELKVAKDTAFGSIAPNVVPFPEPKDEKDLLAVARGNVAQGLSDKAQRDADELFGD